jgi:hypothetical protein
MEHPLLARKNHKVSFGNSECYNDHAEEVCPESLREQSKHDIRSHKTDTLIKIPVSILRPEGLM